MVDSSHIDEIMDNFDFGKVAKVMKLMDWRLANQDHKYNTDKPFALQSSIPDQSELRKLARQLMNDCIKNKYAATATGPFRVERYDDSLSLLFVVTEWTTGE